MVVQENVKPITEAELMALGSDVVRVYTQDTDVIEADNLFPRLVLTLGEIFKLPVLE